MANFAQILVPLDYSDCSDEALRLAARFARALSGRLLVLHILSIEISGLFADFPTPVDATRITSETERLKVEIWSRVVDRTERTPPA